MRRSFNFVVEFYFILFFRELQLWIVAIVLALLIIDVECFRVCLMFFFVVLGDSKIF